MHEHHKSALMSDLSPCVQPELPLSHPQHLADVPCEIGEGNK